MIGDIEHNDIVTLFGRKFKCRSVVSFEEIEKSIDSLSKESSCEKKDYRERYEKLTQSDIFESSYCDKSLGKEESTDEVNCTTKIEDLEEAAFKYRCEHRSCDAYTIDAFKAGAEWQKRKDKETIELAEDHAMLAGMNKMKEEMMKDAVELHIIESFNPVGTENEKPHGFTALCYNAKYPDFYPVTGQTIKVIPFKEIQQNEQDCRKESKRYCKEVRSKSSIQV